MNPEHLIHIILSPHISEKSLQGTSERNEYVFVVAKEATKHSIKLAVEYFFKVKVKAVRVLNYKPQKRIFKGVVGKHKAWKKAYVTLQAKEKIELMSSTA